LLFLWPSCFLMLFFFSQIKKIKKRDRLNKRSFIYGGVISSSITFFISSYCISINDYFSRSAERIYFYNSSSLSTSIFHCYFFNFFFPFLSLFCYPMGLEERFFQEIVLIPSPSFLGIMWMCAWKTTWPAGVRLFIKMLKPSAFLLSKRSDEMSFTIFINSSPLLFGMSSNVTKCFFGITKVWPSAFGFASGNAMKFSDSFSISTLISFRAILQKMQFEGFIFFFSLI